MSPPIAPSPDLVALLGRVSEHLGFPVELVERRLRSGSLESLTLRLARPEGPVEMDVAHVATFEATTWEPAPRDPASLVGARGHTMDARRTGVRFRLATWVDSFDAATIALAVGRRLASAADERRRGLKRVEDAC